MAQEGNQFHPDAGHRSNMNLTGYHQLRLKSVCRQEPAQVTDDTFSTVTQNNSDDDVTGRSALPSTPVVATAVGLVDPAPSDVTNPFDYIMIAVVQLLLKHLQIPNLQT